MHSLISRLFIGLMNFIKKTFEKWPYWIAIFIWILIATGTFMYLSITDFKRVRLTIDTNSIFRIEYEQYYSPRLAPDFVEGNFDRGKEFFEITPVYLLNSNIGERIYNIATGGYPENRYLYDKFFGVRIKNFSGSITVGNELFNPGQSSEIEIFFYDPEKLPVKRFMSQIIYETHLFHTLSPDYLFELNSTIFNFDYLKVWETLQEHNGIEVWEEDNYFMDNPITLHFFTNSLIVNGAELIPNRWENLSPEVQAAILTLLLTTLITILITIMNSFSKQKPQSTTTTMVPELYPEIHINIPTEHLSRLSGASKNNSNINFSTNRLLQLSIGINILIFTFLFRKIRERRLPR